EDVARTRTQQRFERLAGILDCPVITTMGGTGVVPETHPQWLLHMSKAGQQAIAESDLMLAVGTCFPEMVNYGRLRHFSVNDENRKVILLDRAAGSVGVNRPVDHAVIGHLSLTIDQLADALEQSAAFTPQKRHRALRQAYEAERADAIAAIPASNKIHP